MHDSSLKHAVMTCLVSRGQAIEMAALKREVTERVPYPVHAKEIGDAVDQLEHTGTIQKVKTSSGSLAVVIQEETNR